MPLKPDESGSLWAWSQPSLRKKNQWKESYWLQWLLNQSLGVKTPVEGIYQLTENETAQTPMQLTQDNTIW